MHASITYGEDFRTNEYRRRKTTEGGRKGHQSPRSPCRSLSVREKRTNLLSLTTPTHLFSLHSVPRVTPDSRHIRPYPEVMGPVTHPPWSTYLSLRPGRPQWTSPRSRSLVIEIPMHVSFPTTFVDVSTTIPSLTVTCHGSKHVPGVSCKSFGTDWCTYYLLNDVRRSQTRTVKCR